MDLQYIQTTFRVFGEAYEVFDKLGIRGVVARGTNSLWYTHDAYGNHKSGPWPDRDAAAQALSSVERPDSFRLC